MLGLHTILAVLTREVRPAPRPAAVADLRPLIGSVLPLRLKYAPRDFAPGERAPIRTIHVTDVRGGFGLADQPAPGYSQVRPWRKALAAGTVPAPLLRVAEAIAAADGETSAEEVARVLALLERYSHEPYHDLCSRALGDLALHPASRRTSASNGGNVGLAWAADVHRTERLDALTGPLRASLRRALAEQREGADAPIVVVPHRAWSEMRLVDPQPRAPVGIGVWSEVVIPVVAELGRDVCVIGYNTRGGSGRPIPTEWDGAARFDWAGRRL